MLTRIGVAKRLGKSLATVRRFEGNELHPHVDSRGVHWFDEDEVDALAKDASGRRDPAIPTRSAGGHRSEVPSPAAAEAAIERRQREQDRQKADEQSAAMKAALEAARERIEELVDERQKMRSVLRTLGALILDTTDSKTLRHFDPALVAVIRACASDVD